MATDTSNIKLRFNCTANWDEMQQLDGCRFCSHCQKKVYDFTASTQAEFELISMSNNNQICGRFNIEDTLTAAKPILSLNKWVTAALVVLGFNFIACRDKPKTASANKKSITTPPIIDSNKNPEFVMGEPLQFPSNSVSDTINQIEEFPYNDDYESHPSFPGGQAAMIKYFGEHIAYPKNLVKGRVIASFVVNQKGKIEGIKIIRGLTPLADKAVVEALRKSPMWKPGTQHGKPVSVRYTLPVSFAKQ